MMSSYIIREEHGIQCMPCSSQIVSERLHEIHTNEQCHFLKPIFHSLIISFSVFSFLSDTYDDLKHLKSHHSPNSGRKFLTQIMMKSGSSITFGDKMRADVHLLRYNVTAKMRGTCF